MEIFHKGSDPPPYFRGLWNRCYTFAKTFFLVLFNVFNGESGEGVHRREVVDKVPFQKLFKNYIFVTKTEMGGLGAETLGTETFVVSVPVSVPPRLKMSGLVKVSVSRDFILKSRSRSRFHETQNESLGLGLGSMRPKLKVSVSVSFLRPGKLLVSPITAF